MRKHYDVVQLKQWIVNDGLSLKYVEAGSPQLAASEGVNQGGLIDKSSTSRIDKDGPGPHRCEAVAIDQFCRCRRQWRVKGYDIRFGEKVGQRTETDAVDGLRRRCGIDDVRAQCRQRGCQNLRDAAVTDELNGPAAEFTKGVLQRRVQTPASSFPRHAIEQGQTAQTCQHEQQRQLGYCTRIGARHVAYGNIPFLGCFEVDRIHTDADLLYQAQLLRLCDVDGGKRPQEVPDDFRLRQQGVKHGIVRFSATFDVQAPIGKRRDLP